MNVFNPLRNLIFGLSLIAATPVFADYFYTYHPSYFPASYYGAQVSPQPYTHHYVVYPATHNTHHYVVYPATHTTSTYWYGGTPNYYNYHYGSSSRHCYYSGATLVCN
ncbi:MAG: hypothetical protein H0U71_00080 [Gammaproteobacteria bacterium]|nr:hypothetical protein [Gammaproteobacteria bacterium]